MDRLTLALTVAFAVIGIVMVGVWALVRFLPRAMEPPSARTQRRAGYAMIAGGLLFLGMLPLMALAGSDGGRLLFYLVQGGFFLAWGIWTVRQHREGRRGDTTDGALGRTAQGEEVRTVTPPSDRPTPINFQGRELRLGSSDWSRRLEASGERHPVLVGLFVLAVVLAFGLLMIVSMISRLTQAGS